LDVIKPLEVYKKLSQLPDLSQRIDSDNALPGLDMDIVPPHARNDRHKAVRGFRVGDLARRAAIDNIVDDENATNQANITSSQAPTQELSRRQKALRHHSSFLGTLLVRARTKGRLAFVTSKRSLGLYCL
jgi:hypothetical protein